MLLKTAKSEDISFRSSGYWTFLRQNQTKNSALVDSVDMAWSAWHIISAWPGWHENSEPLVGVCYSLPLPSPLGTLSNIACLLVTFPIFICYISSILTCLLIHRSHYKSLRFLAATTHPSSPLSSFLGASPALVSLGISQVSQPPWCHPSAPLDAPAPTTPRRSAPPRCSANHSGRPMAQQARHRETWTP